MKLSRSTRTNHRFVPVVILLLMSLVSCEDDNTDDRLLELRRHQQLWQSQGMVDYQLDQAKSCFCPPDFSAPLRAVVREGEVERAERISDGRPLPESVVMTVDDLFDRIEQAIVDGDELVETTYDPELGFPAEISLNPGGGIQDAGLGVTTTGMTRLEPLASCVPPAASTPCECPAEFPARAYRYTAWDSAGIVVATGCATLTFTVRPGSTPVAYDVDGSRCVAVRCQADVHSAHQGSFGVDGQLRPDGAFFANLNAGYYDFNIQLQATGVESWTSYISGQWGGGGTWGPSTGGTFLLDRTSQ